MGGCDDRRRGGRSDLGDRAVAQVSDEEAARGIEGQAEGTIDPAAGEGGDGPRGSHLGDRAVSDVKVVGNVEVAGGVEGQAPGIVEPAGEGRDDSRGRHLGDRATAVVGNVEVAGGVEGQGIGPNQPAADERSGRTGHRRGNQRRLGHRTVGDRSTQGRGRHHSPVLKLMKTQTPRAAGLLGAMASRPKAECSAVVVLEPVPRRRARHGRVLLQVPAVVSIARVSVHLSEPDSQRSCWRKIQDFGRIGLARTAAPPRTPFRECTVLARIGSNPSAGCPYVR